MTTTAEISAPPLAQKPAKPSPPTSPSSKVGAVFDTAIKGIDAVWSIIKIVFVVALVVLAFSFKSKVEEPAAVDVDMGKFLSMASPLELSSQDFSIGRYTLPPVAVLASLPESERVANPAFTAAQLQRAKWMHRTWQEVHLRNESNRSMTGIGGENVAKQFVNGVIADFFDKKTQKETGTKSISELANINVLVGDDVIPSLASGLLPVFTDSETAAWKAVQASERVSLNELDMRRAKFFHVKYGPGAMPAPAPADVEIRAAEKLAPGGNPWARREVAPQSDNERLQAACAILQIVQNPSPAPAAAQVKK